MAPSVKNPEANTRWQRQSRWRDRNPLQVWAHAALRSGIRRGLLGKQPCQVCGETDAEAHHPDYDRPRAVQWLCRRHHREAHSLTSREKGAA